ncbi:MAG: conjugal transfer protein TraC [Candidatus Brennerbacteria bacterium RIFOXYC1_FULL_41_11]|uniref:Conjugal transfer protein TraC n=1 Tax=Candidatus Brennerbacteria bacterium RIFOXYD1_FULL_41_16 TaxID=1797529 RepID=A0A1G1XKQ8_9BACT|nr:MAG: Type IV secretory pathway VirB4 protein-like protein [Parcubacteria group bacterium GW2011_GWB1_41_4]OGY39619.1 MAG: conjugal transfer protein TraC [Candidatus Brennerbacteria bacterium RIFOXYB1_FULL_41_13]OGY39924.1 MAG: conjugal transfer protein TraC [Candidatus Brennerbacteria bacterium RIFOXYC1_FULL_41_11]OGY40735.1 MAG: conjugal transfer protein TraC [Candidatus Brennerbacteria bacterium RIFOXYD1_FULL_41_16]
MIDLPFFKKNQQAAASIRTIEELTQEELYEKTKTNLRDLITPVGLEVNPSFLKFSGKLVKTLFILSYPKILSVGWLSPVVNLNQSVNVSIFFHPMDTEKVLKNLRKRATQLEAQMLEEQERGLVRNVLLETAISDIEGLRDSLVQGRDKMFYIAVYLTIIANTEEEMSQIENNLVSMFGQKMIDLKPAIFRQFEAYESNLPIGLDLLDTRTPLNIGPASTFFPFISSNLIQDDGIFYGMNMQNSTPVIFDRFSLENSNCVIFAKSGSGKSYFTKLDIIRHLMKGVDVIVVDPENEYKHLAESFGGSFFRISIQSEDHMNPFDLSTIGEDEDPITAFREHILDIIGLVKVMVGELKPEEEAILDQAIKQTYASRDITADTPFFGKEPPILEDLESVLRTMEGGVSLADKLYKYTKGTFSGFINQPTTVDMNNRLSVFSIRDLDEELRPVAMYIILGHIWNLIRREKKKRLLIIDEAWWLMKNNDGANFLLSMAKRARKYFLGVTTITQDVDDFLKSPYGKPIITNSSMQFLMKQASAAISSLAQAFTLTPPEVDVLMNLSIGEGLLFAGPKHLILRVMASYTEDQVITTNPEQLLKIQKAKEQAG